jgi:hypothetical protein
MLRIFVVWLGHFSDYLFLLTMTENTVMLCTSSDDKVSYTTYDRYSSVGLYINSLIREMN